LLKLGQHGELDTKRLTDHTRAQLLTVSGTTIDRILKSTWDWWQVSWPVWSQAGDERKKGPGFVEADLVLHCGATPQGELVHTLTVPDVFTGWTENMALENGADRQVIVAMTTIETRLPFPLVGFDTDRGAASSITR
jgi:hypothetical protein